MILRLVLFANIFSLVHGSLPIEPHCARKELVCYQSGTCIGLPANVEPAPSENGCSAQVQFRVYSKSKVLVRMLTKEKSIKFFFPKTSTRELFGCEMSKNEVSETTGKTLTAFKGWETGFVCELIFEANPMPWKDNEEFAVKYGSTSEMIGMKSIFNTIDDYIRCDMDWLDGDITASSEWHIDSADRRFDNVTCSPDDGSELVYAEGETFLPAASVNCEKDAKNKPPLRYKIISKADKKEILVHDGFQRKVACRRRICAQCKAAPTCHTDGTAPQVIEQGKCKILKCPSDRIRVNEHNATFGAPECASHLDKTGKTVFRWTYEGEIIEKFSCAATVQCQDMNPLLLNCGKGCAGLDLYQYKLSCAAGAIVATPTDMTVDPVKTQAIKCDGTTGRWLALDDDGRQYSRGVTAGTTLHCEGPPAKEEEEAAGVSTGSMIGIGSGVLIFLIAIVVIIICIRVRCCKKKTKKAPTTTTTTTSNRRGSPIDPNKKPNLEKVVLDVNQEKTATATSKEEQEKSVLMKTALLNIAEKPNAPPQPSKAEQEVAGKSKEQPMLSFNDSESEMKSYTNKKAADKKKLMEANERIMAIPATPKRQEERKVEEVRKPRVMPLNEKEKRIARGALAKQTDYPTLGDVESDWDDKDEAKLQAENAAKQKSMKEKTAIEDPDDQWTVDRTQAKDNSIKEETFAPFPRSSKSMRALENLVTQMDTTVEDIKKDKK